MSSHQTSPSFSNNGGTTLKWDTSDSQMKLLQSGYNSNLSSKSDFKKAMNEKLNKWSYFDSNMNHALVE